MLLDQGLPRHLRQRHAAERIFVPERIDLARHAVCQCFRVPRRAHEEKLCFGVIRLLQLGDINYGRIRVTWIEEACVIDHTGDLKILVRRLRADTNTLADSVTRAKKLPGKTAGENHYERMVLIVGPFEIPPMHEIHSERLKKAGRNVRDIRENRLLPSRPAARRDVGQRRGAHPRQRQDPRGELRIVIIALEILVATRLRVQRQGKHGVAFESRSDRAQFFETAHQ